MDPASVPAPNLTLGATELGVLISSVLYGVSAAQTYVYFVRSPNDRRGFRFLVGSVSVLETVHILLLWIYFYTITVSTFGHPMSDLPKAFDVAVAVHGVLSGVVQAFFAFRLYTISQRRWLAIPAWIGCFVRCATSVAICIMFLVMGIVEFKKKYDWVVFLTNGVATAVDLYTTIGLCYFLSLRKADSSHAGNSTVTALINSIMLFSIETGMVTSTTSIIIIVFWATSPDTSLWMGFFLIYTRLFAVSLLVSLNSRAPIAQKWSSSRASETRPTTSIAITRAINIEMSDIEEAPVGRRVCIIDNERDIVCGDGAAEKPSGYAFEDYR